MLFIWFDSLFIPNLYLYPLWWGINFGLGHVNINHWHLPLLIHSFIYSHSCLRKLLNLYTICHSNRYLTNNDVSRKIDHVSIFFPSYFENILVWLYVDGHLYRSRSNFHTFDLTGRISTKFGTCVELDHKGL